MVLCEFVMEIAEEEARRRLDASLPIVMQDIADEIIETAEEFDNES
jgi:hypothetical protein